MMPADLLLQLTCWPNTALAASACSPLSWDYLAGRVQYRQECQALDLLGLHGVPGDSMLARLHCRHAVAFYTAESQSASSAVQDAADGPVMRHIRKLCQDCMLTTSAMCHAD